jgi:hypothetical protein
MRTRISILASVALLVLVPCSGWAQNSVYGIRGIGFPGRPLSVRARALGGAWGLFDRASSLNPATVAGLTLLTAGASYGATLRRYDIGETAVSGLVETRFPHTMLGGGVGRSRVSFAVSFSTYAEQSFDLTTDGTADIGGVMTDVEDRLISDGGIVDARGAVGIRAGDRLRVGAAVHLIRGSARLTASREFMDSNLQPFEEKANLSFSGLGLSAGLVWRLAGDNAQLGLMGRWDHKLTSTLNNESTTDTDLPIWVAGGVLLRPTPALAWTVGAEWRGWSVANGDLAQATAFDTWGVQSGIEFGTATSPFPIRVGARYATLPFSASDQPHEIGLSGGTGIRLAGGRGLLDVALERLFRRGGGAIENGWYVTVGITVQP